MKIVGIGMLLTSVLVLAALWLVPFSPGNPQFHIQHCVPIREALRHTDIFGGGFDMCHSRSIDRVVIGAVAAAALGLVGIGMLLAGRQRSAHQGSAS
ncbi:hypothetical protein [Nocardioides ultimimeridianus]